MVRRRPTPLTHELRLSVDTFSLTFLFFLLKSNQIHITPEPSVHLLLPPPYKPIERPGTHAHPAEGKIEP